MGKAKGKERENVKVNYAQSFRYNVDASCLQVPAKRTSAGDESGRKKRKTVSTATIFLES